MLRKIVQFTWAILFMPAPGMATEEPKTELLAWLRNILAIKRNYDAGVEKAGGWHRIPDPWPADIDPDELTDWIGNALAVIEEREIADLDLTHDDVWVWGVHSPDSEGPVAFVVRARFPHRRASSSEGQKEVVLYLNAQGDLIAAGDRYPHSPGKDLGLIDLDLIR